MAGFYKSGKRATRNVARTQVHVTLTATERAKLERLTRRHKLNASDVVRMLIEAA